MTTAVPEFLQDEFTQEEWNGLTEAEQKGTIEDGEDDGNPTPEELERQQEEERQREEAAAAAAKQPTDEEREAAAAAAAATGKTDEQKQQEEAAAAAEAEKNAAPVTPRPRGAVEATLPDDYDDQVKANAAARKELRAKYNDGDITFEEYEDQSEQLNDKRQDLRDLKFKADLAQESSEQALINHWVSVINPFTAAHPELSEDDVSKSAFDTYLRQTTAPVMNAGGLPGQAEIDKAYAMWCKRFNFTPDGGQQKTTTAKRDIKVPPTLGGLPAASATSVEDGKLAAIQRLSGVEYEEALAKLSPAELEQLSKYA